MKTNLSVLRLCFCLFFIFPILQGCFPIIAAGIGTGAIVAEDRRTTGAYLEDQSIDVKVGSRIGDKFGDKVHVNVSSYNRSVLLTGEVSSEAIKAEVGKIVQGVDNVRNVVNELTVAGASSFGTRTNDTFITSKVKARFVEANKFQANIVKVVTENSVVYLRGIVTKQEADEATEIARNTSGVQKVVKVFEYIAVAPKKTPVKENNPSTDG